MPYNMYIIYATIISNHGMLHFKECSMKVKISPLQESADKRERLVEIRKRRNVYVYERYGHIVV